MKRIKNPKLLKACRDRECYLQIPGVCCYDPAQTVPAHDPFKRKGMSQKTHDVYTIPACTPCHDWLDARTDIHENRDVKRIAFQNAQVRWWETLLLEQIIK